ncbi:MAG TPA: alpha/beta fold hydrolase, partial [Thermoanaerobaculia bacterium]|nr:alpha/beta fold hydrolase [Thermoanaerobaculia bacterium]
MSILGVFLGALFRVAPAAAARVLDALLLTPRRRPAPQRELEWLAGAERTTLAAAGGRLAVWSWGQGRPVLLVHGWSGRGSQLGAFVAPLVAAGCRVVAFDQPGHGASAGRRSSLVAMADAVAAVIQHLGIVDGVIAHSAGAAATALALAGGTRQPRLVFVAPPSDLAWFTRRLVRAAGLPALLYRRARRRIERRIGARWSELRMAVVAPEMSQPLLVIHDRGDREVPWEHGAAVARGWPSAELVSTEGLGHQRILRDERVIASAVGFLLGHRLGADLGV